jgi:RNA polymerase sigma-70 factor (ECF subfamily)
MTTGEGVARTNAPPGGDAELWVRAQHGDREAFSVLYHRHVGAVWRHAYRMTASRAAAEDVLAATFLTAWRRREDVQIVTDSALPWLLAVAGNEARSEWRRSVRNRLLSKRVGPTPDVADHSDAVVSSLDDRRRVHQVLSAIAGLPTGQREAVSLCLLGEVSQADAARVLGISEVTLRSRIHRARLRLRTLVPEEVR